MTHILTRAMRGVYWFGLAAGPFLGAAVVVVGVFAGMRILQLGLSVLPAIVIGVGLLSWAGLIRAYIALVPVPCSKCGRAAKASSLNPVTLRCGSCGQVEVLQARVLGAP